MAKWSLRESGIEEGMADALFGKNGMLHVLTFAQRLGEGSF